MLRVIDHPLDTRPGLGRRAWLQLLGLGLLGLSLPRLLRADPAAGGRARSCVLFLLHGGPSQVDTWELERFSFGWRTTPAGLPGRCRSSSA